MGKRSFITMRTPDQLLRVSTRKQRQEMKKKSYTTVRIIGTVVISLTLISCDIL